MMGPCFNPDQHHRRSIRLQGYDYSEAGAYFVTICAHRMEPKFGSIVDGALLPNAAGKVVQRVWDDLPAHYPTMRSGPFVVVPNHVHGIIILIHPPAVNNVAAQYDGAPDVGAQFIAPISPPTAPTPDVGAQFIAPVPAPPTSDVGPQFIARISAHPTSDVGPQFIAPISPHPTSDEGPQFIVPRSPGEHDGPMNRPAVGAQFIAPIPPPQDQGAMNRAPTVGDIVRGFKARCTHTINQIYPDKRLPVWQRNYHEHIIRDDGDYARIAQYILDNPRRWHEDSMYVAGEGVQCPLQ